MEARQAERLGKSIDHWAQVYQIDPHLMVAIISHESGFRSGIKACWPVVVNGVESSTCDHGLAQINDVWVEKWALDREKLIKDDDYNISVQARVLAWFKRYYGYEKDWFCRYYGNLPSMKAAYMAKLTPLLATAVSMRH